MNLIFYVWITIGSALFIIPVTSGLLLEDNDLVEWLVALLVYLSFVAFWPLIVLIMILSAMKNADHT